MDRLGDVDLEVQWRLQLPDMVFTLRYTRGDDTPFDGITGAQAML